MRRASVDIRRHFRAVQAIPIAGLIVLQFSAGVHAQTAGAPAAATGSSLRPTRVQQPPELDGRLDDPAWRDAARIDAFVQRRPLDGAPATEATEILAAYDANYLYFGIRASYSDAALVRANRVDRDRIWTDDRVSFIFDPFRDQQRAYRFAINGYGVQGDAVMSASTASQTTDNTGDTTWDALYRSAAQLGELEWTAEVAIPFKSLRYPAKNPDEPHRWAFQIERDIEGKAEHLVWAPQSRDVMSDLAQMGVLEGITHLSTSRNLEFLPTVTAIRTGKLNAATGLVAADDVEEAGANVKYGLTSNLTLDFTYNPDFSQIESDRQQIEVNQRFPIQYPELRPFFLEGQEIFRIPGPVTLIHTRTIVDPQFGLKLSGKAGRTTVGLLVANDEAPGHVDTRSDPAFGKKATSVIGRARYDLYRESTTSVMVTDREFMNQHSRAIGGDGDFRLNDTHRFFARLIGTDQTDAVGVRRKGYFYDLNFRKSGRNLSYSLISNGISPDFRTDVGFVRRTDQRQSLASLSYRWWPANWIVSWAPRANHMRNYQFNRTLQDEENSGTVNVVFARNITLDAGLSHNLERYREVDFWKSRGFVEARVASSRRATIDVRIDRGDEIRFVESPFLGRSTLTTVTLTARPGSRLQTDLSLDSTQFTDPIARRQEFTVAILRVRTTYQFSPRLLVRNIIDHNSYDQTFGGSALLTYRVNSGTVFYLGYDDRYQTASRIGGAGVTPGDEYHRTNRAVFSKLQYLLRWAGT